MSLTLLLALVSSADACSCRSRATAEPNVRIVAVDRAAHTATVRRHSDETIHTVPVRFGSGAACGVGSMTPGEDWWFWSTDLEPPMVLNLCTTLRMRGAGIGPLWDLLEAGDSEGLRSYIAKGHRVDHRDAGGTAIGFAARRCDPQMVAILAETGATLDDNTKEPGDLLPDCPREIWMQLLPTLRGQPALASWARQAATADKLDVLQAMADTDTLVLVSRGTGLFGHAVRLGKLETVRWLEQRGIPPGRKALLYGALSSDEATREWFMARPITSEVATWLLPQAWSSVEVVEHLLDAGADPTGIDTRGACAPCAEAVHRAQAAWLPRRWSPW